MEISVLGSGSKGNSIFVNSKYKMLFDAGLSFRQIGKRLDSIGVDISEIDGVFVSHEHTDHTYALRQFQKRTDIPIYINKSVLWNLGIGTKNAKFFDPGDKVRIDDMEVEIIPTSHDACNSCGFLISDHTKKFGIVTDLGKTSDLIEKKISEMDGGVIEFNHDINMLTDGPYPYYLKQRILGDEGHMSNVEMSLSLRENASSRLKRVFLAHLSQNNNTPEKALSTFDKIIGDSDLHIEPEMTYQDRPTDLFRV